MKLLKNLMKEFTFVFGVSIFLLVLGIAFLSPLFINVDAETRIGMPYMPPSADMWLGTDHLGIDMLSLIIEGLRASLYVGLLTGVIATLLGTFLGIYSGFVGGWVDEFINMITNLFITIPYFIVLILISSALKEGRSLELIAVIIGIHTWTWTARSVRAEASSIKSSDHINLAKLNGAGSITIVFKHILPYLASYVFMVFIIQVVTGILMEATISMIGLGPYDSVSLGIIMENAMKYEALGDGAWWAFIPAVILITFIAFSLYTLNTSLEGVFNPRLRKE